MDTPVLTTERLILRKFTNEDSKDLFLILGDKETNRFLPWFPLNDIEETSRFISERFSDNDKSAYHYAVCLKRENRLIGYVNVSGADSRDLGYCIKKEFWHMGIAIEACEAVVDRLKKDGVPYITATHDVNNLRSGNVMKRLGMQYKYSYEELWQPKNISVIFRMYQLDLDAEENRVYKKYWDNSIDHFIENDV